MSQSAIIKKLQAVLKPKKQVKFVFSKDEITHDDDNIIWILYTLQAGAAKS
jgi:hypothetical protein